MFEIVDDDHDDGTPEHRYTIKSSCEPDGSGELTTYVHFTKQD